MQGFFLGLSSGAVCAAYCAPSWSPTYWGKGRGVLRNFSAFIQFLLGRLLGYLAFAVVAWGINASLPQNTVQRNLIIGSAYVVLFGFADFLQPVPGGARLPVGGRPESRSTGCGGPGRHLSFSSRGLPPG